MMKSKNLFLVPFMSCALFGAANANWQYPGTYVGDGWYSDDGSRFVMSLRGGASIGRAGIKNEIGSLTPLYYVRDADEGGSYEPFPEILCSADGCDGFSKAGFIDLGKLPVAKDFESFTFAAGASIGVTLPNRPQWRMELGWDHIGESNYNASPFLEGRAEFFGGDVDVDDSFVVSSGAVQSDIKTDVISAMAFYDFFSGLQKPLNTIIPYVGIGVGYADIKTTLNLSDPYGDLSGIYELLQMGERDESGVLHFFTSEKTNSTIAGLAALGVSYGLTKNTFLDFGARVTYVPKVLWTLSNEDGTRHRDWFSAENLIYANITLGIRMEF